MTNGKAIIETEKLPIKLWLDKSQNELLPRICPGQQKADDGAG